MGGRDSAMPRAVLRRQEAAENSQKGIATLPSLPPRRRARPSPRLLHCSSLVENNSRQDFRRESKCFSCLWEQPDCARPHAFLCSSEGATQVGLSTAPSRGHNSSRERACTRPAARSHRPTARPARPRPRPQRALPATLRRGAGPDSAARGLGEGRNQ